MIKPNHNGNFTNCVKENEPNSMLFRPSFLGMLLAEF